MRENATLVDLRRINPDLGIFRIRPDAGPLRPRAGQFLELGLPDSEAPGELARRPFSLSCTPVAADGGLPDPETEELAEFYIAREREQGATAPFSARLFDLRPGHRLWLGTEPAGRYSLDPVRDGENLLFCATGTGEAPHNRMIVELLRRGHTGRIVSVVSCRRRTDFGYLPEHRKLEKRFPGYTYIPLTTREPQDSGAHLQDRLDEISSAADLPLEADSTRVFLCGNFAMVGRPSLVEGVRTYPSPAGMIEVLETRFGFTADDDGSAANVHFERY